MKILYILGAYKPRPSANGICSENVIEALKEAGHEVTILANDVKYGKEKDLGIYCVKQRLFLRLVEIGERYSQTDPMISKVILKSAWVVNKIQLLLMSPLWPKVSLITNRRFKHKALRLQEQMKFDMVIAVYTPIEALLAGYEVKKKNPSVIFIPYFLDSLSGGYGPKIFSEKNTRDRGLKIEKKIFEIADKIVLMKSSMEHQKKYNLEYSSKMEFLDIPMLKLNKRLPECEKNHSQIKFLFVGSIAYKIRNPQILIDALAALDREDIVCEFVGNIDCKECFEKLEEKMGNRLKFLGFMKHDELEEKFASADVLLNVGNLISTMVPSKIFEYMSYKKPIISTYSIKDEPSKKYLEKYPMALLLSGDRSAEANAQEINNFINNNIYQRIDSAELEQKFFLNMPQTFVEYIVDNNR